LNVPIRFPAGSRTGPDEIASVPESSTSTISGSHEKGALGPSKKPFHRSATWRAPRDTPVLDTNTVSSARNLAKAAASRSAIVLANAISVLRTWSFNSALVSAQASPAAQQSSTDIHRNIRRLLRGCDRRHRDRVAIQRSVDRHFLRGELFRRLLV